MKKESYKIKNTLGMFDLLKGCMMFLMIMAHTYGLFDLAYGYESFEAFVAATNPVILFLLLVFAVAGEAAMPILFVVSGYGYRKTTFKKCVTKQAKMLLYPYAVTAGLTVVIHFLFYNFHYRTGIREAAVLSFEKLVGFGLGLADTINILGHPTGICGPMWFLIALFTGNVIFNQLLQHFEGLKLFIAALVVALIGWVLGLFGPVVFVIPQSLIAVFYICLGYLIKKNKLFTTNKKPTARIILILLILAAHLIMRCFGEYNLALNDFTFGPISIIVCGLSACVITYLFLYLNRISGKISGFIRQIGRYSLYVLAIHTIEIIAIGAYVQYEFVNNFKGNHYVASWTVFGVRLVVVLFFTFLYVKLKDRITNKLEKRNAVN